MLKQKIVELLSEIEPAKGSGIGEMPKNTYFMKDGNVLCMPRQCGESRFPYPNDGYILWAHSTGHIHAKTGIFNVFKPVFDSNEPSVEFFAGVENDDGTYFPVSVLGAAKQLFEPFKVERYLVYTLSAAYYIADTDFATFAVRASMSKRQEIVFSFECINKTDKPLKICFTSFFDAFLKNGEFDNMWEFSDRRAKYLYDGAFVMSRQGGSGVYAGLCGRRLISGTDNYDISHTISRQSFLGTFRTPITSALCLKTGEFADKVLPDGGRIVSEIIKTTVVDSVRVDYVMTLTFDKEAVPEITSKIFSPTDIDAEIAEFDTKEKTRLGNMNIMFDNFIEDKPDSFVFNGLIKTIQKQVDNCAFGRYYVDDLMGIRDVYQQLEQALIWDSKAARKKMLEALSFLDPSGRAPRQYSLPPKCGDMPKMDLRQFIDQGNWIISCFYSYLAWTKDYSILEEDVGYYEITGDKTVKLCEFRDSALQHLIKIMAYLESNLDTEEGSNCLKILFGDWNDVLDGLGHTKDEGKEYGTGVSVMASLHFYQNLLEMNEILRQISGYEELAEHYMQVRNTLKDGLIRNAIAVNDDGKKRLVHGWGDHKSYYVGSFSDSDNLERISFASNAFWVTSGLIKETPELKDVIINDLHALKSEFGLKTLTPPFTPDTPGVGRLAFTPPGIAENSCVYIHATMFSILALFGLGDANFAWEQFLKVLPISNEQITKTPFVMSNSYMDNPELDLYGQSPIDWYTGSGTVFVKNIVRSLLGINPKLSELLIAPPRNLPCRNISASMPLKGVMLHYEYKNEGKGERKICLNGEELPLIYSEYINSYTAVISDDKITDDIMVTVID